MWALVAFKDKLSISQVGVYLLFVSGKDQGSVRRRSGNGQGNKCRIVEKRTFFCLSFKEDDVVYVIY